MNLSLAQMRVRSGDQLVMPNTTWREAWARIIGVVFALPALVLAIRAFR